MASIASSASLAGVKACLAACSACFTDTFDPDKGQRSTIFWGAVSTGFFDLFSFSNGLFPLSPVSVQFNQKIRPRRGENCPMSARRKYVKSCHISGCYSHRHLLDDTLNNERSAGMAMLKFPCLVRPVFNPLFVAVSTPHNGVSHLRYVCRFSQTMGSQNTA